jgi:hypothetical protein
MRLSGTVCGPARKLGSACAGCTVDIYSEDSAVAGPDGAFEAEAKPSGPNVTATASDAGGSTSPFSQPLPVPP